EMTVQHHVPSVWPPVRTVIAPAVWTEAKGGFCVFRPKTDRHGPCDGRGRMVSHALSGIERRKSPRIDVLRRVKGELIPADKQIIIHDLSRTGFAVVSEFVFDSGQQLDFRLTSVDGATVTVTAEAVHSRKLDPSPNLFLTGFRFIAGPLTGLVPQSRI